MLHTVRKLTSEATAPLWVTFEIEYNSPEFRVIKAIQALSPAMRSFAWAIVAADFHRTCEDALKDYDLIETMGEQAVDFVKEWKREGMQTIGSESEPRIVVEFPKITVSTSFVSSKARKPHEKGKAAGSRATGKLAKASR